MRCISRTSGIPRANARLGFAGTESEVGCGEGIPQPIPIVARHREIRMKLDYHIVKSAVNLYFGRYIDVARRPTFFDVKTFYPELDLVTQAYPAIRAEFERVLAASRELPQYHE